jgi:hypothetical protein
LRQLDAVSPRDPVSEKRGRPTAKRALFVSSFFSSLPPPNDSSPPFALISAFVALHAFFPKRASGTDAARAPALVLSALPQKALNSNGCKCFLPYTKRPAGRCCSLVVTAAWYAASLASVFVECVEDAPGERLRLRSVLAGELGRAKRSGVTGASLACFERSSEETKVRAVCVGGDAPNASFCARLFFLPSFPTSDELSVRLASDG